MIYIDSFSLSPSFFKVYDKGTLLDEFDGIHSEYILFCYILNRMLFYIKRQKGDTTDYFISEYRVYSISFTHNELNESFNFSKYQIRMLVSKLETKSFIKIKHGGVGKGTKTTYSFCFKRNEDGGIDVPARDFTKISGLFDDESKYVSCDDFTEKQKKGKKRLKKSKVDLKTAETMTVEELYEYIYSSFKNPGHSCGYFKLNAKYKEELKILLKEHTLDDIRLATEYVVSEDYKEKNGFPRSPSRLMGGSFQVSLDEAKKWEKSWEKFNKRKDRIKELNLKEFEA